MDVLRGEVEEERAVLLASGEVFLGALDELAKDRPDFVNALVGVSDGRLVPVPGGVIIKNADGDFIGAVGVSGDTSDNDEAAAVAGIEAAGLEAVI